MTFFSCDRGGLGSGEGLTITKYWKGVALSESQYLFFWAQLFEGRLALNLGLNLTRVSFSFIQKHFLG